MPSQTKENYLKAIYFLANEKGEISLSDLSKSLAVSIPTVNSMVKKLQQKGWVIYQKYKPLKLTAKGKKSAALIIRKHRLTEMYLVEKMGMGWEEVHDIAEQIEHIDSPRLFDRIDELLDYPKIDPHGSPIPDKDGNIISQSYKTLAEINTGQKVRLVALTQSPTDFLLLLNSKKLELGTAIKVISIEAFDKSMTVSYSPYENMMLSHEVTTRLLVEEI